MHSKTLAKREREMQEVARVAAEKTNYEKEKARQERINAANNAAILRKGLINTAVYSNTNEAVVKKNTC